MNTNECREIQMGELLFKEDVFRIVSAAFEVHNESGAGFAEAVYQEAMQIELAAKQIPFEPQKILRISYKGRLLEKSYMADLVCFSAIIIEIKAIDCLTGRDQAQLLNYLKATGLRVGLLLNFGDSSKLQWQRLVK
jgi:GxxExxY protein